jgi:hypothetical protein
VPRGVPVAGRAAREAHRVLAATPLSAAQGRGLGWDVVWPALLMAPRWFGCIPHTQHCMAGTLSMHARHACVCTAGFTAAFLGGSDCACIYSSGGLMSTVARCWFVARHMSGVSMHIVVLMSRCWQHCVLVSAFVK